MMGDDSVDPFAQFTTASQLTAHVVSPDASRIHGYDVREDVARHYRYSDLVYLTLTGELPDEVQGRAFEACLFSAAPISVADAPSHAARIARVCGGESTSVFEVAAVGLAQEAHATVKRCQAIFDWCDEPQAELPEDLRAGEDTDRRAVEAFLGNVPEPFGQGLEEASHCAAILAVLHRLGLTPDAIVSTLAWARLPAAFAEASAAKRGDIKSYPVTVPAFDYAPEES